MQEQPLTVMTQALRLLAPGFIVIGVALLVHTVVSAPTRTASRLGLRGLKRTRVLAENELWASVEPVVRWLGVRLSGIPTDEQRASMEKHISLAGDYMGLTADEYLALSVLSTIVGGAMGAVLGFLLDMGGLMVIVGLGLGAAMPYFQISGVSTERLKAISRGLPYTIDLMALAMSAGLDFPGAVRQVVEKSSNPDDPIVEEFTLILQTLNLGRTRRDALIEFARRCPAEAVTEFVNALIQAEERGNPVAEVLVIQATVSRTRRSVNAEEKAAKAGVKLVGPLMLVFFCVMGLLLGPALLKISADL